MDSQLYQKLDTILCKYPNIYRLLGGDFLRKQCEGELKSYILKHLAEGKQDEDLQHLSHWESQLVQLGSFPGFSKLQNGLGSGNHAQYYEALIQIETTVWFAQRQLLKEMEPELPHRRGYSDMLLSFGKQPIYAEVTSRRFPNVIGGVTAQQIKRQQRKRLGLTEQDIEHEERIEKLLKALRNKARCQLPPDSPGILVLQTGRAAFFSIYANDLADKLFASTSQALMPHVILLMLWSLDRGSHGEAPFWFVNPNSRFKAIGQALLEYLGQKNKAVEYG